MDEGKRVTRWKCKGDGQWTRGGFTIIEQDVPNNGWTDRVFELRRGSAYVGTYATEAKARSAAAWVEASR